MRKCPICDSPIGDTDYSCPTCHLNIVQPDKKELEYMCYPFCKSVSAGASSDDLNNMMIADGILIGVICVLCALL